MRRVAVACILMLGLVGCRSDTPVNNAELARELDVLKDGLEAWKNGSTPASLESGVNPFQFSDSDWKAGAKLLEYRVLKAGGEDDGETLCTVSLKLEVRGKSVDRTVNYRVTLTPKRTVARSPKG